jgi:beta-aspartyl-peptidase (threonine type)
MMNAHPARIGDSPLVGAGTWAQNPICAISATGTGEVIIQSAFAHEVDALMRLAGLDLDAACQRALDSVRQLGGRAGCVALDGDGRIHLGFFTSGMPRGAIGNDFPARVAIFGDEEPS